MSLWCDLGIWSQTVEVVKLLWTSAFNSLNHAKAGAFSFKIRLEEAKNWKDVLDSPSNSKYYYCAESKVWNLFQSLSSDVFTSQECIGWLFWLTHRRDCRKKLRPYCFQINFLFFKTCSWLLLDDTGTDALNNVWSRTCHKMGNLCILHLLYCDLYYT